MNCPTVVHIAANFQETIKAIKAMEKDSAELHKYATSLQGELSAAHNCLENDKLFQVGCGTALPQRDSPPPPVS